MASINLATTGLPQKQGMPYRKGIISIATVIIILTGGYFWLAAENNKTAGAIGAVNSNYLAEYQKLTTSNKEIVDFQNRIALAKDLLAEKNTALNSFSELEKDILSGAYLTAYGLDGSKLTLSLVTDNFDILARQIASFKKNPYFSTVSVGRSSLNDTNKVTSEIVLNIN